MVMSKSGCGLVLRCRAENRKDHVASQREVMEVCAQWIKWHDRLRIVRNAKIRTILHVTLHVHFPNLFFLLNTFLSALNVLAESLLLSTNNCTYITFT